MVQLTYQDAFERTRVRFSAADNAAIAPPSASRHRQWFTTVPVLFRRFEITRELGGTQTRKLAASTLDRIRRGAPPDSRSRRLPLTKLCKILAMGDGCAPMHLTFAARRPHLRD